MIIEIVDGKMNVKHETGVVDTYTIDDIERLRESVASQKGNCDLLLTIIDAHIVQMEGTVIPP